MMRGSGGEEKSLDLLRSQERVVSMLYHKTFPVPAKGGPVPKPEEVTSEDLEQYSQGAFRPHTTNELPSLTSKATEHKRPNTEGKGGE